MLMITMLQSSELFLCNVGPPSLSDDQRLYTSFNCTGSESVQGVTTVNDGNSAVLKTEDLRSGIFITAESFDF